MRNGGRSNESLILHSTARDKGDRNETGASYTVRLIGVHRN